MTKEIGITGVNKVLHETIWITPLSRPGHLMAVIQISKVEHSYCQNESRSPITSGNVVILSGASKVFSLML